MNRSPVRPAPLSTGHPRPAEAVTVLSTEARA
jgi:hypothetical protein